MDATKFLREMAKHYKTNPSRGQEMFVQRIQANIAASITPLLCEADGGLGKTIGYLVCGMHEAVRTGFPLIIATSTTTNRDQIEREYSKVVEYARQIGDPISDLPLFNYRSVRDYASPARLKDVIDRHVKTGASRMILDQLYEVQDRLNDSTDMLLETIMPCGITNEKDVVVVERQEIAEREIKKLGKLGNSFLNSWEQIKEYGEQACVVVMTQAMFANSWRFRKAITAGNAAMVVIDEVDKLTSIDFVTFTSLAIKSIENVVTQAENAEIDTDAARESFNLLCGVIDEIKQTAPRNSEQNVILTHEKIGEELTKRTDRVIADLANHLHDLAGRVDEKPITEWDNEITQRRMLYAIEELTDSADRLCEFIQPRGGGHAEWVADRTDLEVFLSWLEGDEFRVVTARPGGLMEWLFRPAITVPVLLTTAFLGEQEKSFAHKIGLPIKRLNRETAIRARRRDHGELKFVYFTNLHDAIVDRTPNPEHFDDIERMLSSSPWSWEPETRPRIVVLAPGYKDIQAIHDRLKARGSNAPVFPHTHGTNINDIRDRLVQSKIGGILLTVYWEGFNIVGDQADRRGLIDVLLMSRIPFQRPNLMLESLHEHLGLGRHLVIRDIGIEAKRRIHQGFNRVIRGPNDKGVVLICDSRFPPPAALTELHDEIYLRREHTGLLEAIPDRFRFDAECFDLVDAKTWETL